MALAVGLALVTAAECSFAFDYTDSQGVRYNITSYDEPRTASVASGNYVSGDITIPSTITVDGTDYTVTKIEDQAFCDCTDLMSITIPEGVTTIGDAAFINCRNLTSVTIPESVTTIGEYAFNTCRGLTSVTIPEGVTKIGDLMFYGCSNLTSITIPSKVNSMGEYVFACCDNLIDVYVKEGQSLGENPFYEDNQAIVWRYSEPVTQSGKTHVIITSVEDKDGNPSSVSASLTCDAMGENYVIGAVTIEDVQLEHTLAYMPAKAATCTEAGNTACYTCSHCGKHFSDEEGTREIEKGTWAVPATGHNMTAHAAVAATCTEAGHIEGYTCDNCKKHFSDAEGTDEIGENDWVVPATGHNWGSPEVTREQTDTEDGEMEYVCKECGEVKVEVVPAPGRDTKHSLKKTEAVGPTCTEAGNTAYYTCYCGKHFSDEEGTTEIQEGDWVVPATGHTWGNWTPDSDNTENHKHTCTVCEAVQTGLHNWSSPEVTKEVTDTEAGEMKYVCEECSAERLEVVPALENYDMDPLLEQTVDKNGEPINCKVQDPYKVLPEGVRLEIKLAEGERYDELKSQLDPTHPIENVAFFDIRLLKESNNESVDMPLARPVRVLLQIPEGWDKADMEAVLIAEDADIEFEEDIVTIDGVDYVAFWTITSVHMQ